MGPLLPLPIPKLMSYQRDISPRTTSMAARLSGRSLAFTAISRQMMSARPLSGRWHLVPNAVPLATYTFRERVPADAPFVFLGRIEQIKGPDVAIDIARRTGRKLVIAGNVPDEHRAWFQAHVAPSIDGEQIRYVGPVDDVKKNALLGAAAALLMPIGWDEPFGIVMIEAMACGTPVLGFRRGAVPEVVEDGVTGLLGDSTDDLVVAAARLDSLSRRATRQRVERLYSADAVTEKYLDIYRHMVEARKRPRMLHLRSIEPEGR
jgi:glycosyltransferase involved in cell wall biosynthesis